MRRLAGLALAACAPLIINPAAALAHDGDVSLTLGGLEVTQSIQTFPQEAGATIGASVPLTSHKPAVVRAYVRARRFAHLDLGFFAFHLPVYSAVSVNGTLTISQGGSTIATIPASNGPISVTPWASPDPGNPNSSLNFEWAFPADGTVTFQLDLTSNTAGIPAIDPPSEMRTFEHNRRVRIQGVRLQYDHDNNLATPPTKTPDPGLAADGYQWMLKSGPLAPCKLQYWVNPTPVQITTDLSLTSSGAVLTTLAGMKTQGSITYDNVYGWWQGGVSGNGLGQNPSCASPPSSGAYGNTELSRYQRTFTHEVYHNYCEVHVSETLGVVGWDTALDAPVPADKFDVMVAGQLTANAWQSPTRYTNMYDRWLGGAESFLDPCHFDWWEIFETFTPLGPPLETELQLPPVELLLVSGVVTPDGRGRLEPAWRLTRNVVIPKEDPLGDHAVQLLNRAGQLVAQRRFLASFEGDGDPHLPMPSSFTFEMNAPLTTQGALDLSQIRLVKVGGVVLDAILIGLNLPAVQIVSPDPRQTPVLSQPFLLRAQASDPDGDALFGSLQYSPDGGQSWLGIANSAPIAQLGAWPVDPAQLPGGGQVLFRAIVTDGANTAQDDAGPFQVPRHAGPEVLILSPPPDPQNPQPPIVCELVPLSLVGFASSPDDGVIPCQRLEWSSSAQGPLGNGCSLDASLKAGSHTLLLTAFDRAGQPGRTAMEVEVLPTAFDRDEDGTPDCADRCPDKPGPPENGGCPYDETTVPLMPALRVVDGGRNDRTAFTSFFDVFFEVGLHNPRSTDVRVQGLRFHLTEPRGAAHTRDVPFAGGPVPIPAGGEGPLFVSSFFDIFTDLSVEGEHALVVEAILALNETSGRHEDYFAVDSKQTFPIARVVASDPGPAQGSAITACTFINMGGVPGPLGSYGASLKWKPDVLRFQGFSGGQPPFDTPAVNTANAASGVVTFADADPTGASGDVYVACFQFSVIGAPIASTPLDLELTSIFTAGSFIDLLPTAVEIDDSVAVELACRIGDVNGDASINSGDALIVLSAEIGLPIPPAAGQAIAAGCGDANGDGSTNSLDAAIILAFEIGLPIDPSFPIGRLNLIFHQCPMCADMPGQGAAVSSTAAARLSAPEATASQAVILGFKSSSARVRPGDTFELTMTVDVGSGGRRLGSYAAELRWDARAMRYAGVGGSALGSPLVNDSEAASGRLRAAAADPQGVGGGVELVRLRFAAQRALPDPARGLDARFSSLGGAAPDFQNLLPLLVREPGGRGKSGERD